MSLLGLGVVGVVIGAAGAELLRATKPEFVKKIEESAKRFTERVGLCDNDGEQEVTDESADE